MERTANLGLTVDLAQDTPTEGVPVHLSAANENFKLIDAAIGDISAVIVAVNGEEANT